MSIRFSVTQDNPDVEAILKFMSRFPRDIQGLLLEKSLNWIKLANTVDSLCHMPNQPNEARLEVESKLLQHLDYDGKRFVPHSEAEHPSPVAHISS